MYNNTTPVSVCILPILGHATLRFAAIRRAIPPRIGELAFPGGFVDEGESAEMAASRETLQETGIETDPSLWKVLCTRVTPNNILLIFLQYQPLPAEVLEAFEPTDETSELTTVCSQDVLAFPLHQEILLQLTS